MKPTFTPAILPSQKKADGTFNIKIHVTFKRKTKRLSTNLTATTKDLNKALKLKEGPLKRKAYEIAEQMQAICDEIDYLDLKKMEVEDIVKFLDTKAEQNKAFNLDFVAYMREKAKTKGASEKLYNTTANALERYLKGRVLDVNDITVSFLRAFEEHLKHEPKMISCFQKGKSRKTKKEKGDCRAISQYLGCIRHMYGLARIDYNEPDLDIYRIPRNPFEYYIVPKQKPAPRRNKSQEFIQMIINESAKAKGAEKFALEIFILSFALEGMNLADLYTCAPAKKGWLIYNRRKTSGRRADNAEHHVFISDKIAPLIEKYKDYDGEHMFSFHRRFKDFNSFTNNTNSALRRWREDKKIEHFTMYAARHSFGTLGRKAGNEKATMDEMLCHVGDLRMADIYIEKSWDIHKDANEKLLDLFDWSPIQ